MEERSNIRLLRADEMECRVATVSAKGVSLLLYKDARVDQNILDETFGIFGWKREHMQIGSSLFCTVSIRGEKGEWVSKQDVGTESFAEPIKGAASDSFKRACFNIGIGRELYTAPFLWVPAEKADIRQKNGKYTVQDHFKVSYIEYDEKRCIAALEIQNEKGQVVCSTGRKTKTEKKRKEATTARTANFSITAAQERKLRKEMERTEVEEAAICQRYQINGIKEMNKDIYERAIKALEKTKSYAA